MWTFHRVLDALAGLVWWRSLEAWERSVRTRRRIRHRSLGPWVAWESWVHQQFSRHALPWFDGTWYADDEAKMDAVGKAIKRGQTGKRSLEQLAEEYLRRVRARTEDQQLQQR